eukprot:CAMPEP_0177280046 /NCGR_PEP_ID=MMETSP0367-20130122/70156_1 /TAXON_ID=447022 ORGANISM="Scrippsiella hangoei-like, Strain SHHI-4" /NCGR_SAMPLE_ID=MMETSP0367 /ASSEMBLY_ACC=CAM_ASM_000362 /LENGTH=94 /DNA_ID=CAMNT_0018736751 /DNA_START=18 /DNA_END=299 /DNA_ORIENTATION=-
MLDALGQSSPKPRLRGAAVPPPEARTGGSGQDATLRPNSSPYHYAQFPGAHPMLDVHTESQKHAFVQEHWDRKLQLTTRGPLSARAALAVTGGR